MSQLVFLHGPGAGACADAYYYQRKHFPDSVWPNSRDAIERQMRHLSPEMRRKLTHDNAAALYGLGGA